MHKILFYNKFIKCLYMFRALCAHHQEVKIVLYNICYHHTCRWLSRAQVERNLLSTNETHYTQENTTITTHKRSQLLILIETRYQLQPSDKELYTEHIPLSTKFYINVTPSIFTERNDQCGNQRYTRELLMMGIVVPETCWAYKKYNKILSGI